MKQCNICGHRIGRNTKIKQMADCPECREGIMLPIQEDEGEEEE